MNATQDTSRWMGDDLQGQELAKDHCAFAEPSQVARWCMLGALGWQWGCGILKWRFFTAFVELLWDFSGTATLTSPSTAWNVAQGPWNSIPELFSGIGWTSLMFAVMCKWCQKHGNRVSTFGTLLLLYLFCFWGAERRLSGWDDAVDWAGFAAFGVLWHSNRDQHLYCNFLEKCSRISCAASLRWPNPCAWLARNFEGLGGFGSKRQQKDHRAGGGLFFSGWEHSKEPFGGKVRERRAQKRKT